jgi:hypothetical protein
MSTPNPHQPAIDMHAQLCPIVDQIGGRWECEKEYEDFAEYAKVLEKRFPETGGTFIKATKRPFGYIFEAEATSQQGNKNMKRYRTFIKRNRIELEMIK